LNLNKLVAGLKAERERIDAAIGAIQSLSSTGPKRSRQARVASAPKHHRRRLSAAARARIAAAQRRRWAKAKQAATSKPARRMSKSARRKIAAAQKARWAKVKAQAKAQTKVA